MKLTTLALAASTSSLVLGKPILGKPSGLKRQQGLQWIGTNEAGAEFGENNIPGELGCCLISSFYVM
ncbi:hypothetical protein VTO42DRAFT_6244 [Malbranchea cinnamomea]